MTKLTEERLQTIVRLLILGIFGAFCLSLLYRLVMFGLLYRDCEYIGNPLVVIGGMGILCLLNIWLHRDCKCSSKENPSGK